MLTTKAFHWDSANKALVTEMSQVREFVHGKVIKVMSHVTLNVEEFDFNKTFKSQEGEIEAWEFVPSDPNLRVKKLLILND